MVSDFVSECETEDEPPVTAADDVITSVGVVIVRDLVCVTSSDMDKVTGAVADGVSEGVIGAVSVSVSVGGSVSVGVGVAAAPMVQHTLCVTHSARKVGHA
jgi:hypothetical protein